MVVSSNWAAYLISGIIFLFNSVWHFFDLRLPWRERLREVWKAKKKDIFRSSVLLAIFWAILFSASFVSVLKEDRASWEEAIKASQQLQRDNQQLHSDIKTLEDQNRDLHNQLAGLTVKESPNSLRRRTLKLADEMYLFVRARIEHHPQYATPPPPNEPPPDPERQKVIKASMDYDQATTDIYLRKYRSAAVGIVKEYESKGIATGYLGTYLDRQPPYYRDSGTRYYGDPSDELFWFRSLAFRVDAYDNPIRVDY